MADKIDIVIPEPQISTLRLKITGTAPLIMHQFSEKAKRQILDKQMKKANKPRDKRNPKAEFENSVYVIERGKYTYPKSEKFPLKVKFAGELGVPALWIKSAIVDSARNIDGVHMTTLRGAVFVKGRDEDGLIPIKYESLTAREDIVRLQRGSADLRYRGQLNNWSIDLDIKYNEGILSAEQVANLIKIAGFSCGLGEWRPQKNGEFGTFDITPAS